VRGGARRTTEPSVSILNPNSHARLEIRRLSLRIETEAKRIAIMIADHPFGLPGANTPSGRSPVTTALVAVSANSGKHTGRGGTWNWILGRLATILH
jgi:hypothetical protein